MWSEDEGEGKGGRQGENRCGQVTGRWTGDEK